MASVRLGYYLWPVQSSGWWEDGDLVDEIVVDVIVVDVIVLGSGPRTQNPDQCAATVLSARSSATS
jgi:hypothetical protein